MQKLNITKLELMQLAAILKKRHPQNEELLLEEMKLCWKISAIHPVSEQPYLVAYIHKTTDNGNPVLLRNGISRRDMGLDLTEIPTISRYHDGAYPQRGTGPGRSNEHY